MKKLIGISLVAVLVIAGGNVLAQGKKGHKVENAKAKIAKMKADLELSDDQVEKVKEIFKAERASLKETRLSREEMQKLSDEDKRVVKAKMKLQKAESAKATKAQLSEVLSAEQMTKFEAIKQAKKEKRKEFRKEAEMNKLQKGDMHQVEPK